MIEIDKVIGIGASAGGLEAIIQFFKSLPAETGHAYVIVQHLSPHYKSLMPEILSKHCAMPIYIANDRQELLPNCVYLNRSTKNLIIKGLNLSLPGKRSGQNLNLPIDLFFHSLGKELKERSIGIIFSGTGSDGSRGIKSIKENGGLVYTQSLETTEFISMPEKALETGLVDHSLSPADIAKHISSNSYNNESLGETLIDLTPFDLILIELKKKKGVDFTRYKISTLKRRLDKRLKQNQSKSIKDYLKVLKKDDKELDMLYNDFLVGVTEFFRNEEAFKSLITDVFPAICREKKEDVPIRIWVPGCSTGQEAYSIAIALDFYLDEAKDNRVYQIFASDINEDSLHIARSGIYDMEAVEKVDEKYVNRYFKKTGKQVKIISSIRDRITFTKNDILEDPPFIKMDLVSCRNLLIYLDENTKNNALINFKFFLRAGGFLFLGDSESLGYSEKDFKTINSKWKIFKAKFSQNQLHNYDPLSNSIYSKLRSKTSLQNLSTSRFSEIHFYKYISDQYSPSLIFIDKECNIHFIKGNIGDKLNPKEGLFQQNILKMVDNAFGLIIQNGIHEVEKKGKTVVAKGVSLHQTESAKLFDLYITQAELLHLDEKLFVLEFSDESAMVTNKDKAENLPYDFSISDRIENLEQELHFKNEELRSLLDELETRNEEIQSSNEELMASNEELQSTNEELQSVIEELYTVNSELQQKNDQVQDLYTDLANLYSSQDISSIFLDKELSIRFFTPSISKSLDLKETDVGRPLANFMFFNQEVRDALFSQASECLSEGGSFECQFDENNRSKLLKVNPFLKNKQIEGVIVTLIDIDELVKTQTKLSIVTKRYEKLFHNLNAGFSVTELVYDKKNKPINLIHRIFNKEFENLLSVDAKTVLNQPLEAFDFSSAVIKNFTQIAAYTEATGKSQTFEYWFERFEKHLRVQVFSYGEKGFIGWAFFDITKEIESEKVIAQEKEKYEHLFQNINCGFARIELVLDRKQKPVDLRFITINNEYKKILEITDDKSEVRSIKDFSNSAEEDQFWLTFATKTAVSKEPQKIIHYVPSFNKYLEVNVFPGGKTNELGFTFLDVSVERMAEEKIKNANTRLNLANDISEVAVWEWNVVDDRIENYNKGWEKIYEIKPVNASSNFNNVLHEEDKEDTWKDIENHLDGKSDRFLHNFRVWNKSLEKHLWIKNMGQVVEWDKKGKAVRVMGVSHDITEQKEYETKILKERAFRELLTETSTCGIYIFDVRLNRNIYINKKGAELLDTSADELQSMDSQTFINQFHPEDVDVVIEHINYLVDKKKEKPIKYRFKIGDESYRHFLSTDTPFEIDKDGKLVSYIGSFIDITKQEEIEKELISAKEEAEQASKQKDLFLSNMSHEIRTPLNGVIGFSKLLRKENLSPKKKETYLEQIEGNSHQLMTIINDVLNLSKIDSGSFELNFENINFHRTLQSIVDGHKVHLQEMEDKSALKIVLTNKFPKKPIGIKTDEVRLSQVINNLITNAIKYSKKGTIEVGYKIKKKTIDIWVKDEGVGIKKDQLELIFERFSQVHEKLSRQTGGIGLGLAISKAIVDVLGGTISVSSTYRIGSTFTLTIPYEAVEVSCKKVKNNRKVKKVIVGDDSPSVQFYFKSLLEDYDIELLQAFDGSEVINLLKDNEDVDLVFMDMRMPNMDGPTALQNLRKFNQDVKVVGQSAFAIEEQVEKFKSYGFDDYITKPIDEDKLKKLINH